MIRALRSHDDLLADQLDELRIVMGRRGTVGSIDKIIFDLPKDISHEFEKSIKANLIEFTTSSWHFMLGELQNYKAIHGDCLVPTKYKTKEGDALGNWVGTQRMKKDTLSKERRKRLDDLGFVWGAHDTQWESNFNDLVDYHKEFNNVFVPQHYENKNGFKLGDWVGSQRRRITPKRRDKLDKLGFVWNPNSFIWEKRYKFMNFKKFKN